MSFRPIEERISAIVRKPASIRLVERAQSSRPSCVISLRGFFAATLQWKAGNEIAVQIGEGDDAGKLRLVRGGKPSIAALRVLSKGGASVDLGHIASLNDGGASDLVGVDARVIDKDTVEIALPDWSAPPAADEVAGDDEGRDERPSAPPSTRAAPAPAPRPPVPAKPNGGAKRVEPPVTINGVHIDFTPDAETVTFKTKAMEVTKRQAQMIAALARGMPNPIARDFLRTKLFGQNDKAAAELALDTISMDLLKAVGGIGLVLKTVKGVGFALQEAGK
jgi:hypothetical protein